VGYNSATYYSPGMHATIAVADNGTVSLANAKGVSITGLAEELAMATYGRGLGFGLAPGQGIAPLNK
jgi:hypothetical protein